MSASQIIDMKVKVHKIYIQSIQYTKDGNLSFILITSCNLQPNFASRCTCSVYGNTINTTCTA